MSEENDKKNKSVIVREKQTGSLETLLTSLPPEIRKVITEKAAEEVVKTEIEARGKERKSGLAMDEVNEVINLYEHVKPGKVTDSITITSEHETGTGHVKIKARKGVGCFIATIAFDSPEAEEVRCLRKFRDNVLCNSQIGIRFINWYYRNGPRLATIVGQNYWMKWSIRKMLSFLISVWKAI
jgi:hypothetical protein